MELKMQRESPPILWIVIPCYNEQEVLPITAPMFLNKILQLVQEGLVSGQSRILFVNDGSGDRTWEIIRKLSEEDPHFLGIAQSRNRGHQNAVLAGLMEAKAHCDITVSIDCDGQDDVDAMDEMVRQYLDGCEIVYGVRSRRDTDTWFKRVTAESFYRLMNGMGTEVIYNHADYRLVSARVLDAFEDFREVNLFLRGMFPLVGFKSTSVYYERHERIAGESHYPLSKMLALALDGITSMSTKPIRLITGLGCAVALASFIGVIWSVIAHFMGVTVAGWSSMVSILCFLGGIQLLGIGVIGEYVGKTYMETKHRPRYIISDRTWEARHGARNAPESRASAEKTCRSEETNYGTLRRALVSPASAEKTCRGEEPVSRNGKCAFVPDKNGGKTPFIEEPVLPAGVQVFLPDKNDAKASFIEEEEGRDRACRRARKASESGRQSIGETEGHGME